MPWRWDTLCRNPHIITVDAIKNNPLLPWKFYHISRNYFNYDHYFQLPYYKKKMTKILHDTIHEELIATACRHRRVLMI